MEKPKSDDDHRLDQRLEEVFLEEILSRISTAQDSIHMVNRYLNLSGTSASLIFQYLELFLHSVSSVSLILWPSPSGGDKKAIQKRNMRGKALRELLNLPDTHILSDHRFRNDLAHMDERIETWWDESRRKNIARRSIGPRNFIGGLEAGEDFEHLVPDEGIFIFRGNEYDINSVSQELGKIKLKVIELLNSRGRHINF